MYCFLIAFIFAGLLGLNSIHCYLGQLEDAACQSRIVLSMAQVRLGSGATKGRGASVQRFVASSEAGVTSSRFGQGEEKDWSCDSPQQERNNAVTQF
jgi:hypothetical protein